MKKINGIKTDDYTDKIQVEEANIENYEKIVESKIVDHYYDILINNVEKNKKELSKVLKEFRFNKTKKDINDSVEEITKKYRQLFQSIQNFIENTLRTGDGGDDKYKLITKSIRRDYINRKKLDLSSVIEDIKNEETQLQSLELQLLNKSETEQGSDEESMNEQLSEAQMENISKNFIEKDIHIRIIKLKILKNFITDKLQPKCDAFNNALRKSSIISEELENYKNDWWVNLQAGFFGFMKPLLVGGLIVTVQFAGPIIAAIGEGVSSVGSIAPEAMQVIGLQIASSLPSGSMAYVPGPTFLFGSLLIANSLGIVGIDAYRYVRGFNEKGIRKDRGIDIFLYMLPYLEDTDGTKLLDKLIEGKYITRDQANKISQYKTKGLGNDNTFKMGDVYKKQSDKSKTIQEDEEEEEKKEKTTTRCRNFRQDKGC